MCNYSKESLSELMEIESGKIKQKTKMIKFRTKFLQQSIFWILSWETKL